MKEINLTALHNRILACLYAGALGDALGYAVEFDSWTTIQREYGSAGIQELELSGGKAVVSDDTQMTLFTAEGLGFGILNSGPKRRESADWYIYQSYLCWLHTQGFPAESEWDSVSRLLNIPELNRRRAPGNTCLSALGSGKMGTLANPVNNSKGCGGVMRTAPLGFVRNYKTGKLVFGSALEEGAKAAAITHGHPMGWIPSGMLSDIVDRCLYGNYDSLQKIIEDALAETSAMYGHYEQFPVFEDMIRRAIELAAKNKKEAPDNTETDEPAIRSLGEGWVGDEALAVAVYAALRWDHDLKQCLRAAVNHKGDSDSTGAIAGNILGAYLGLDAVPEDWVNKLELTDAMNYIADLMIQAVEASDMPV